MQKGGERNLVGPSQARSCQKKRKKNRLTSTGKDGKSHRMFNKEPTFHGNPEKGGRRKKLKKKWGLEDSRKGADISKAGGIGNDEFSTDGLKGWPGEPSSDSRRWLYQEPKG